MGPSQLVGAETRSVSIVGIHIRPFFPSAIRLEMRIIRDLRSTPQSQHRDRHFAGDCHLCFLFCDASSSLRYSLTEVTQITIFPEWTHYILRSLYEQSP